MIRANKTEAVAAEWLAREDGERWDSSDAQALERWLDADVAHRVAYLRLRAAWDRAERLAAQRPAGAPKSSRRRLMRGWPHGAVAAAVSAALLAVAFFDIAGRAGHEISTPVGGRESVALADGSRMTLNTDSRVHLEISGRGRLVVLERGEAYFDVRHDPAHPFTVIAGPRRITDVGTRFSVWRDGAYVRIVVEQGAVRIDRTGAPAFTALARAPTARASSASGVVTQGGVAMAGDGDLLMVRQSDAEVARDLSWRDGMLSFNQTTLREAAAEFNRYNTRKLVVADSAASIRIDGAFKADNVISFARLIHDGFGLEVDASEGDIRVSQ